MRLEIGEYLIETADEHNITVSYRGKAKDRDTGEEKEVWRAKGYYGSLFGACRKVLAETTREADIRSVNAMIMAIKEAEDNIVKAIEKVGKK